jgi:hypothetical protein
LSKFIGALPYNGKVFIDDANPSFIKSLKLQIGEEAEYDKVIARYRAEGLGVRI